VWCFCHYCYYYYYYYYYYNNFDSDRTAKREKAALCYSSFSGNIDKAMASSFASSAKAPDDMYDFSGVASDLAVLRSQLITLQKHRSSSFVKTTMDTNKDEDDEEWYPPSPPIYDVVDKLIEVNREFYSDPTSTTHLPGRLRWRPELVQIKWLYSNDCENSGFISDDTEDSMSSSDDSGGCGGGGLAEQLAKEMSARLNLSSASSLFPPKLATIEDTSPVQDMVHHFADYNDEDFEEEASIDEDIVRSPLKDDDIVSHMAMQEAAAVNNEEDVSSSSSDSCRTVTTINNKKSSLLSSEANNNINNSQRPSRPKTKTTVIRTHSGSDSSTAAVTSELPKSANSETVSKCEAQELLPTPPSSKSRTTTAAAITTSVKASSHATIKVAHSNKSNNNNNNSSSSSGEEGSSSTHPSTCRPTTTRSSSLQSKTVLDSSSTTTAAATTKGSREVITETRPKANLNNNKSSVYLNGNSAAAARNNGVPTVRPRSLQRKTSRNSLSSNSSVSSQATEDSATTSDSLGGRRSRPLVHHRHPSVVADVMSPVAEDSPSFLQWKLRKREEKRLRERKSYLEQQMRRH
jgi:hypothetical protein